MKKYLLLILCFNFSFSQVKVDSFNIEGENQIPGQYIVYEFDNLSEDDLYLGVNLWLQQEIFGRTDIETFPNKSGFLLKDQLKPLPYGYKYQSDLGARRARGIELRYQINIRENRVRFFLESIYIASPELRSGSEGDLEFRNAFSLLDSDFSIPASFSSADLYLDVKLRELKYQYTINGFDRLLKTINRRANSLKTFLDNFSVSEESIVGNFEYKKVDSFSLDENNPVFPYQYREFDVEGFDQAQLAIRVFFELKSFETNNYSLFPVHSFVDEKRDIRFVRYNMRPIAPGDTYPYFSLILFYNNNKLRLILDNFAFVNETFLGESLVPKGRTGSYPSNINNIWLFAKGRNDFTPINWSWNEIDDYQTSFYFRPNGKERKGVVKNVQQMTAFFNYIFDDFKKTVEQTVFTNDDW